MNIPLFFGKVKYRTIIFQPKEDITAYEFSQIWLSWYHFKTTILRSTEAIKRWENIPEQLKRHFVEGQAEEYSWCPDIGAVIID